MNVTFNDAICQLFFVWTAIYSVYKGWHIY